MAQHCERCGNTLPASSYDLLDEEDHEDAKDLTVPQAAMKHTPGPWRINQDDRTTVYVLREVLGGAEEPAICATVASGIASLPLAEAEANARLIAAAPDLYEVCKLMLDYMAPDHNNGHSAAWTENTISLARAALAKVEVL